MNPEKLSQNLFSFLARGKNIVLKVISLNLAIIAWYVISFKVKGLRMRWIEDEREMCARILEELNNTSVIVNLCLRKIKLIIMWSTKTKIQPA